MSATPIGQLNYLKGSNLKKILNWFEPILFGISTLLLLVYSIFVKEKIGFTNWNLTLDFLWFNKTYAEWLSPEIDEEREVWYYFHKIVFRSHLPPFPYNILLDSWNIRLWKMSLFHTDKNANLLLYFRWHWYYVHVSCSCHIMLWRS